jgi:signal transduction histidine kinase
VIPQAEPQQLVVDVKEVISDTIAFNKVVAHQKKQKLQLVFNDSVPQFLETDPVVLQQTVNNLINNAINVLEESASMSVRADFRNNSLQVLVEELPKEEGAEEFKEFFVPTNILSQDVALNSADTYSLRRTLARDLLNDTELIRDLD